MSLTTKTYLQVPCFTNIFEVSPSNRPLSHDLLTCCFIPSHVET